MQHDVAGQAPAGCFWREVSIK